MTPDLLHAAAAALGVQLVGWADDRLTLTGPVPAIRRLAPHLRANKAAVLALLRVRSAAAAADTRTGYQTVEVYDFCTGRYTRVHRDDVRAFRWNDLTRADCRDAVLAELERAEAAAAPAAAQVA